MSTPDVVGKALTVLGPLDPAELGLTTTHEHLLVDLGLVFVPPADDDEEAWKLAEQPELF